MFVFINFMAPVKLLATSVSFSYLFIGGPDINALPTPNLGAKKVCVCVCVCLFVFNTNQKARWLCTKMIIFFHSLDSSPTHIKVILYLSIQIHNIAFILLRSF